MPHGTLLHKLASGCNIGGALWSWIKVFFGGPSAESNFYWTNLGVDYSEVWCPPGKCFGAFTFYYFHQ